MSLRIIDMTFTISSEIPKWPGSVGYDVIWQMKMPNDTNNLSSFAIDSHQGAHLDAPLHFIEKGKPVETLEFENLIDEVFVLEIYGIRSIDKLDLEKAHIHEGCNKLILKTDNQFYWKQI